MQTFTQNASLRKSDARTNFPAAAQASRQALLHQVLYTALDRVYLAQNLLRVFFFQQKTWNLPVMAVDALMPLQMTPCGVDITFLPTA